MKNWLLVIDAKTSLRAVSDYIAKLGGTVAEDTVVPLDSDLVVHAVGPNSLDRDAVDQSLVKSIYPNSDIELY